MDKNNVEKNIITDILSETHNLNNISDKDLKSLIRDKIIKVAYLNEDWQLGYAIERIFKELKLSFVENSLPSKGKMSFSLRTSSDQTIILLAMGLGIHIIYTFYSVKDYGYIISQYGTSPYLGRVLGTFFGEFFPVLIISGIISILPYYIFRGVAEKYKKYLDYFAVIFLILTALTLFSGLKILKEIKLYQNTMNDRKINLEATLLGLGFRNYDLEGGITAFFPDNPEKLNLHKLRYILHSLATKGYANPQNLIRS